ncbi:hypothetical protein ACFOZ0_07370 [Streptomyces yaanensis]|uniref:Uncharacterized protein n=1 Tax=Streptomyces yaanensis TaxID=1142239 RepID=A0ABV7SCE8_9ACTN|nr:hypothetical protein [Streptomyces sp. CGMCC 4.7035]WNC02605.1 hypothetical protein Q2K21_33640 [Streptomyces sp. CGMCC 4.7035]
MGGAVVLGGVAAAIRRLFGERSPIQSGGASDHLEALPRSSSLPVVISGPESVRAGLLTAAPRYDPKPIVRVAFRLADAYDLGGFRLSSASWDLAESVPALRSALAHPPGDALCELAAGTVEFTTRDGATLSYCRPSIKVVGPWRKSDQHAA